ncbi:MAG: hypothetical protein ACRCSK_02650 [Fusobacteriaceae bacterium]
MVIQKNIRYRLSDAWVQLLIPVFVVGLILKAYLQLDFFYLIFFPLLALLFPFIKKDTHISIKIVSLLGLIALVFNQFSYSKNIAIFYIFLGALITIYYSFKFYDGKVKAKKSK